MERRSSVPLLDTYSKESSNGNKSQEGTEYIPARCRITKPNPPKPAKNPLQFVKVGPCDLYRSAQEQLKKVEVIKKIKQEFKEDGEDWQANLDNWKSSRRKRQEHIIERVVEIRNSEQDGEKSRRRSKTFSEMLEDRNCRRRKLSNLAVYASGDDDNDLSDLGISTRKSSFSGESSLDDTASNKDSTESSNLLNGTSDNANGTSSNNNKEEYTYESAIQDYKSRVKRRSFHNITDYPLELNNKSEDRRFSLYSLKNEDSTYVSSPKADVPKIDISERKQLFETGKKLTTTTSTNHLPDDLSQSKSIKERLKHLEKCTEESLNIKKATKLLTGDIMTVRDRLSNLVSHTNQPSNMMYHCQSLDSLDQRTGEYSRPIAAASKIAEHVQSLEGLDYCDTNNSNYPPSGSSTELLALSSHCGGDTDREDSGIQTADVSCSVSQADDPDDDSDTMPNNVCAQERSAVTLLNHDSNSLKTYLSSIELPLQEEAPSEIPSDIVSPEPPDDDEDDEMLPPVVASPTTKSSDTSSVVEELITCTINMDLTRNNKIIFDDDDITCATPPLDPFLAPPKSVEPPKEKPPPPPIDDDDDNDPERSQSPLGNDELKRFNSTKRIKNEIRNKRSSFLGIEGIEDFDLYTVTKPQDAVKILQEELQLEKEMYRQQSQQYGTHHMATSSSGSVDVESRDSGVELETTSNSTPVHKMLDTEGFHDEEEISKREREIIENLEKEEQWRHSYNSSDNNEPVLRQNTNSFSNGINNHFSNQGTDCANVKDDFRYDDDEDVIRVERELLELEQEELERQREDLLFQNRKAKLLENQQPKHPIGLPDVYIRNNNPSRQQTQQQTYNNYPNYYSSSQVTTPVTPSYSKMQLPTPKALIEPNNNNTTVMSRHTLHALSAAPKSKLITTDSWIQSQPPPKLLHSSNYVRENYNQHWLIQEAEERRISQANNRHHFETPRRMGQPPPPIPSHILSRKDLPVPRGAPILPPVIPPPVAVRPNRVIPPPVATPTTPAPATPPDLHDKMLSVSGKKKCSHCGDELGRGAAMIIESLRLFYHMDCFKCCVCHVQLGDGLMGTDVRVRNHKLHCHNCYSSDDGVKFSCV